MIDLLIKPKGGQNSFCGPKLGPKAPLTPRKDYKCLTPQNDHKTWFTMGTLRHEYASDNQKFSKNTFFCFLEAYNDEIAWFSVSRESPVV